MDRTAGTHGGPLSLMNKPEPDEQERRRPSDHRREYMRNYMRRYRKQKKREGE